MNYMKVNKYLIKYFDKHLIKYFNKHFNQHLNKYFIKTKRDKIF